MALRDSQSADADRRLGPLRRLLSAWSGRRPASTETAGPRSRPQGIAAIGDPRFEGARWFLDQMPEGFAVYDRDWRYVFVNRRGLESMQRTAEELIGRVVWEVYPGSEGGLVYREYHRAMRDQVPVEFVDYFAEHDAWYEHRAYPTPDALVTYARDVTQRRRAEIERDEAIALLAATLEATADGILAVDGQAIVKSHNRRLIEMFGCDEEVVAAGRPIAQLGAWMRERVSDPEAFDARFAEIDALGEADVSDVVEFRDGRVFERVSRRQAVAGRPAGRVWSFRDVTQRHAAESARRAHAEVLRVEAAASLALAHVGREVIRAMNSADLLPALCRVTRDVLGADAARIYLADGERRVYVPSASDGSSPNDELLRLIPLSAEQLAPTLRNLAERSALRIRLDAVPESAAAALARRLGIEEMILIALRRDEEIVGFLSAGFRRPDDGSRDVAERIAADIEPLASMAVQSSQMFEELQRANRLKSDFVATMSHELRTPLNVILGYLGLILEGDFGRVAEEVAAPLRRVEENARQLLELIQDTLDLSRLESGRIPVALAAVALDALVADVVAEISEVRAARPEVALAIDVDPGLGQVITDAPKLRIVLRNLLVNALKFTERGRVGVVARRRDDGVEIAVEDTGVGIAPGDVRNIFEPFHQLGALTERRGGVGLGLYVSARLVEALGGEIAVESEVGRGSRFIVRLPDRGSASQAVPRPPA